MATPRQDAKRCAVGPWRSVRRLIQVLKEFVYTDPRSSYDDRPSVESQLIRALRSWLRDPSSVAADGRPIEKEIESLLEWYIGACLGYGPPSLEGWWCDGVICLHLSLSSAHSIKLLGVAWIDASRIAPFEIDVELDPTSERFFARTLFRIGSRDGQGRPTLLGCDRHTDHVLAGRPRRNRDWAMAIELTPPERTEDDDPSAK